MNELIEQMVGWVGYIARPPVQWQLLLIGLAFVVPHHLGRLLRLTGWPLPPPWLRGAWLTLALLAVSSLLLILMRQPDGLVLFFFQATAGWQALSGLRLLLRKVIHPRQLRLLDTRLIRPIYLMILSITLIQQFDNPMDLALIPLGEWFGAPVTLGQVLLVGAIIYVLAMGAGPPAEGAAWLVQKCLGLSQGSRRAMALMIRYALFGAGIVWALTYIGFNSTAILAVAGGLSVGIGFGVKEVFSNFISGLWLLFEGSVRPGGVLLFEGDPCEVRSLGLRAAVLFRDRDNSELVIPNQTFFTATTTTFTGSDQLRRSQVLVGAAYRHNPRQVIALLEETARACDRVLDNPPPRGLLLSYGDSSVLYALRFFIADPMQNISICSEVQASIWEAFKANGIEIPFPQRVNHRAGGAEVEATASPATDEDR